MKSGQHSRSSPRVLVIEDEPFIAALLHDMVHELGYETSGFANSIASARREISKRNYDVVLLDLGLDGHYSSELADLLIEMKLPFAFVTGYTQPFEARLSHIRLLQKPFTFGQLCSVLNALSGPPTTRCGPPNKAA